jgi:hypothetical protein
MDIWSSCVKSTDRKLPIKNGRALASTWRWRKSNLHSWATTSTDANSHGPMHSMTLSWAALRGLVPINVRTLSGPPRQTRQD